MKQFTYIITVLFLLLVTSCSAPQNELLVKEYTTTIGQEPKISNNVYDWENLSDKQAAQLEIQLKEATDKILGFIPTETHKMEVSASTSDLYSSYVWENEKVRVNLWVNYKKGSESIQLVYKAK
jgi:hypothetical protein